MQDAGREALLNPNSFLKAFANLESSPAYTNERAIVELQLVWNLASEVKNRSLTGHSAISEGEAFSACKELTLEGLNHETGDASSSQVLEYIEIPAFLYT